MRTITQLLKLIVLVILTLAYAWAAAYCASNAQLSPEPAIVWLLCVAFSLAFVMFADASVRNFRRLSRTIRTRIADFTVLVLLATPLVLFVHTYIL